MTSAAAPSKRVRTWATRSPEILRHLETDAHDPYTRKEVEVLFQVSRASATRLMKIAGAEVRNGAEAIVSRVNLRICVGTCPEITEAHAAEKRALRIEQSRNQTLAARRLTAMLAEDPVDEFVRFKDLLAVNIADGRLTIEFANGHDLNYKLWELSKAIANDTERYLDMCEPKKATVA